LSVKSHLLFAFIIIVRAECGNYSVDYLVKQFD